MSKPTSPLTNWQRRLLTHKHNRQQSRVPQGEVRDSYPVRRETNKISSRLWQILPYTGFGTLVFIGVSSAHLNQFFAAYLVLIVAQLGTLGIYLLLRKPNPRHRQDIE